MAELRLLDIVKRYGQAEVIHGVDLEVEHGEFVVFVGPSGCGKSTLLRMIAGLEDVTDGAILIDGQPVNDVEASKRGLAMVFQSYALYPHMTVRKNLAFGLETMGTARPVIEQRLAEAARILKLEPMLDRRPAQLSGGQRQRVAIGRAIVREPKIFLFDEPLSNLDAELRVQMRVEIAKLHERLGATMIYVTHDQVEAMTMADKIVVLQGGNIEQVGSPLDLYNKPSNLFVAGFIGSPRMNFLKGRVGAITERGVEAVLDAGGRLLVPRLASTGLAAGAALTLGVRPEHLQLGERLEDGAGLLMAVTHTEHLGRETYLYGTLASEESLTVELEGQVFVEHGRSAAVRLDPTLCHLFGPDGLALEPLPSMAPADAVGSQPMAASA